jgi:TrkA domain protein
MCDPGAVEVFETRLPGVGVRYEFTTAGGERLGVLVRRDGRREIVAYDKDDPDAVCTALSFGADEAALLVDLLGGSKVTERIGDLRHEVEGLSIEWVTLPAHGGLTGRTIADGAIRRTTGASVVAVIRGDHSIPGPGPEFELAAGDVALVVGSIDGVQKAQRLLTS